MLRAGADPEVVNRHEMRHMLTRALGTGQALDIAVSQIELQPGDVLLACSDGLYGPVGDAGLAQVLASAGGDVDAAAGALIAAALDGGGPDNVTALLVGLDGSGGGRVGRGERGQALTEYVVTAGLLVAIGIVVSAMLIDVMRNFVIKMVHELSFLTP